MKAVDKARYSIIFAMGGVAFLISSFFMIGMGYALLVSVVVMLMAYVETKP